MSAFPILCAGLYRARAGILGLLLVLGGGRVLALRLESCEDMSATIETSFRGEVLTLSAHRTLLQRALLLQPREDAVLSRC
jgi:hypothetical protein